MKKTGIGLLLIGHGASRGGGGPLRRLALRLSDMGRFDEVAACFWKERPFVAEGLGLISSPTVLAVPVFATEGRIAKEMIPREMGLSGRLTHLPDGRLVHYLHPVGVHPGLAALADARAGRAASTAGFDPGKTALLLIAHGNKHGGGARESAEQIAQRLRLAGDWSSVTALFLEEKPRAADWQDLIGEETVVVLPLLLAEGQHAAHDVAPLFGLGQLGGDDLVQTRFGGRRIAILQGLADDQAMAWLILRMAEEALLGPNPPSVPPA